MLQALELTGFKSFADRTRFEFHKGVTVVVGPNGSGKSNVVDAIKWVLGSQSAKSLRGGEMTDVIFNGSGSRGPLHTAEVTLTLDNRDQRYGKSTPGGGDAEQLAITRRVYRSGEGEYLINGAACRLRDIRELLAGSGIGTEAYSIIEQGKVDGVLQASPRERRLLFEEAAGISRFRSKRQEAARRLARVEQNLLRLSDIVDEVESRLRSVRMQAGKAQRYREQARRLKELRTEIALADWFRITERLATIASDRSRLQSEQDQRRQWIAEAEQELPAIEADLADTETRSEQLGSELARLREAMGATTAHLAGLANRREDLARTEQRLERQWLEAWHRQKESQPPTSDAQRRLREAQKSLQQAQARRQQLQDRKQMLASQTTRSRAQLETLRERLARVQSQRAVAEQKLQMTQEQTAVESERALQAEQQITALAEEAAPIKKELDHVRQQEAAALDNQQASAQRLAAARETLHLRQQEWTASRRERQEVEAELSLAVHRRELIAELDREQQQQRQQVRAFVRRSAGGEAVAVADLLHVEVDTAPLIEAALGVLAEYFVIPSTGQILAQLRHAAEDLPQGAKLLRLDYEPASSAADRMDLTGLEGVWGRADQFVDAEPEYASLIRRLLGRTWIVDHLTTAVQLAERIGRGLHFVTSEGDVLTAEGMLVVGARQPAQGSLTRRSQLDALDEQVAQLQPVATQLQQRTEQLEQEVTAGEAELSTALEEQATAVAAVAEHRERLAQLTARVTLARDRQAGQREQLTTAQAQWAKCQEKYEKQKNLLVTCEQQQEQLEQTIATLEQQHGEVEQQTDQLREAATREQATIDQLGRQVAEWAQQVPVAVGDPATKQERLTNLTQELHATRETLADLDLVQLTASSQQAEQVRQVEAIFPLQQECRGRRARLRRRAEAIRRQLQQTQQQVETMQNQQHKLEVAAARIEQQRQTLVDRLQDDYQIDLPAMAAQASSPQPAVDRDQAEKEIEQLRVALNRIGAVNVDALEELENIESRYEAISAQYNDLSQAKASLEKLMNRLNTESRQLFLATVETVRGHFQELFRRLFGGGSADLVLEEADGDDAMECGIEVRACPPGKETRTLSLLSGGERTMTCVALLLAMFRSKPSPFCILDEVDAALDEANIGRFTGVLSDFLSSTQFVVISHSKKTMTGADTLYGVTMQESGISKQVSVKFDDVSEEGVIQPRVSHQEEPPRARAA